MDITSYLLGKQAGGGGGGGITEYIDAEVTSRGSDTNTCGKWRWAIKKFPAITNTQKTGSALSEFYYGCLAEEIDCSNLDASNLTSFSSMFNQCYNLTTVTFGNIDTTKLETTASMFMSCSNLTTLDLSAFHTPNLINTTGMFRFCSNLTKIDMRNFDFSKVSSSSNMFGGVPNNCEIIVKSQTEKDWILSIASNLTNVVIAS